MFLTAEELAELTGRTRRDAQVRMLRAMGITHMVRPDGSVAVMRAHVEQLFGVGAVIAPPKRKTSPDFSMVT